MKHLTGKACMQIMYFCDREWEGMGVILPGVERDFPRFFVGLGREEIKVCDAFWKQEMSPWSNAPPGLRNPFSKTYF